MLNILLIISITCLWFSIYQFLGYLLTKLLLKFFNQKDTTVGKPPFFISITLLIVFLAILIFAISLVSSKNNLSNLEFYLVFSLIGICSIFWCYFESNLLLQMLANNKENRKGWKSFICTVIPRFSSKKVLAQKKALVFGIVFVFSFALGYKKVLDELKVEQIDLIYTITNTTIVASMLALDRFLNQIHTLVYKES